MHLPKQVVSKNLIACHPHIKTIPVEYYHGIPKILIGQDNWPLIVSLEMRYIDSRRPVASRTNLGWVIHGCVGSIPGISTKRVSPTKEMIHHLHYNEMSTNRKRSDDEIHELIKSHFHLEAIGISRHDRKNLNVERARLLLDTLSQHLNNHWVVPLLWKEECVNLPDNKQLAISRLLSLEKKMDKNTKFKTEYNQLVSNLLQKEYAIKISENGQIKKEYEGIPGKIWYLPHFGVENQNKPGKIRLVHDASAKFKGTCLNDNVLLGPNDLQLLPSVLMKFRQKPIAFTGDIREMFLQIKVRREDWNSQRFLWRGDYRDRDPETYAMTSLIFGSACSPSTALYVRDRNAQEQQNLFPEAVRAIHENHYMDDYLDSVDSVEEAIKLINEVSEVHRKGGFEIRGWLCNSPEVIKQIQGNVLDARTVNLELGSQSISKVLGLRWDPSNDTLSFAINLERIPNEIIVGKRKPTKREMLRIIMSVYDPLGFLYPHTVRSKMILQSVWKSGIGWDEVIEDQEFHLWKEWISNLKLLENYTIPRCYTLSTGYLEVELHMFADAGESGYAAIGYWRFKYPEKRIEVSFVMAKARVAPLKPQSVPRMELQAALMASRLGKTICEGSDLRPTNRFFWSDSITVLRWIHSNPWEYKTFVSHRLGEIDEVINISEWNWVPSAKNPADAATKWSGSTKEQLQLWRAGPEFLTNSQELWPKQPILTKQSNSGEERCRVFTASVDDLCLPNVKRFNNWLRLIRTTARLLLVPEILLRKRKPIIMARLIKKAEHLWIRLAQQESFNAEISNLRTGRSLPENSRLRNLTPILNEDNILVVGGRLSDLDDLPTRVKFPPILDGKHPYTILLIKSYHERFGHGNHETVINELRQSFWIIKTRSAVRSVAFHCQQCRNRKAKPEVPRMGNIPSARIAHHQRPFTNCGIDYFGPMLIVIGRRHEKRWGVLFTCLTSRAVHIELANSLSTDSAVMALRRMAARRGHPTNIYSDNGTNLRGASAELKKAVEDLDSTKLQLHTTNLGINWHFIPPAAPHMGGCWERLVRSIKTALRVVLKERTPKEETLHTLLIEAEHIVNSRPLTHVSSDNRDPEALTPNHFLIGSSSGTPLLGQFGEGDLIGRKQWRVAQALADSFWNRWVREYLPGLSPRPGVKKESTPLKVGDVTIVVDGTLPRNSWPKGIVEKLFPGRDGRIRVVEVRTTRGIMRRPVTKIIRLETSDVGTG